MCPNCHSQTETYAGKNKEKVIKERKARQSKIVWPTIEEMSILVFTKPIIELSKDLGVSDVAINKFCKKHNIIKPKQGHWLVKGIKPYATVDTNDLK